MSVATAWQSGILRELRDAEVQYLGCYPFGHEDVLRLEIAMTSPRRSGHRPPVTAHAMRRAVFHGGRPSAMASQDFAVEKFRYEVRRPFDIPRSNTLTIFGGGRATR